MPNQFTTSKEIKPEAFTGTNSKSQGRDTPTIRSAEERFGKPNFSSLEENQRAKMNEFIKKRNDDQILRLQKQFGQYDIGYVGASFSNRNMVLIPEIANTLFEWLKNPRDILLIHGPPGTAKSYTCCAMLEFLVPQFNADVNLISESKLKSAVESTFGDGKVGSWIDFLENKIAAKMFILDDFGSIISENRKKSDEVTRFYNDFTNAFLNIRNNIGPTVITTNFNEKDMSRIFGERITSRLFATKNTIISYDQMPNMREIIDKR